MKPIIHVLNIIYPVPLKDVSKFEKINPNVFINVYKLKKNVKIPKNNIKNLKISVKIKSRNKL